MRVTKVLRLLDYCNTAHTTAFVSYSCCAHCLDAAVLFSLLMMLRQLVSFMLLRLHYMLLLPCN